MNEHLATTSFSPQIFDFCSNFPPSKNTSSSHITSIFSVPALFCCLCIANFISYSVSWRVPFLPTDHQPLQILSKHNAIETSPLSQIWIKFANRLECYWGGLANSFISLIFLDIRLEDSNAFKTDNWSVWGHSKVLWIL